MAGSNRDRLSAYVESGLRRAEDLGGPDAAALLRANAQVVRRHLAILERWAADEGDRPCPPHLHGLNAFDLSDAAERLEAQAVRREAAAGSAKAEA